MEDLKIMIKAEVVGGKVVCHSCGNTNTEGEYEEGCEIITGSKDSKFRFVCPNCGSDDVESESYLKIIP
jgi:predicted RNA-binding Zn-ribbon protein involved in translation (DUF1610 family)